MVDILYRVLRKMAQINSLELDNKLKNKLKASWFRISIFKRYDADNKLANMLDYKVKFLDYDLFRYLFDEIFLNKEYYFKKSKDVPFIIDCGSNIGMSILYFKMLYPNANIVAFEPGKETYNCINENIQLNNLTNITVHNVALSNFEGEIDFYYDQDDAGSLMMSSIEERMPKHKCTVPAVLLSTYIDKEVDFMKIDIEGAEMSVFEDLNMRDKFKFINRMVVEYHHHINKGIDEFSRMLKILEDNQFGYHIEGHLDDNLHIEQFQDIIVYAYKK